MNLPGSAELVDGAAGPDLSYAVEVLFKRAHGIQYSNRCTITSTPHKGVQVEVTVKASGLVTTSRSEGRLGEPSMTMVGTSLEDALRKLRDILAANVRAQVKDGVAALELAGLPFDWSGKDGQTVRHEDARDHWSGRGPVKEGPLKKILGVTPKGRELPPSSPFLPPAIDVEGEEAT